LVLRVLGVEGEHPGRADDEMVEVRAFAPDGEVVDDRPLVTECGELGGDPFLALVVPPSAAVLGLRVENVLEEPPGDALLAGELLLLRSGACAGLVVEVALLDPDVPLVGHDAPVVDRPGPLLGIPGVALEPGRS
jgi:hypothetical protein